MNMLADGALIVLGAVIASIGYLVKRRLENTRGHEFLDRSKKLLDIHKQMNDQGVTAIQLRQFEEILSGRKNALEARTLDIKARVEPLVDPSAKEDFTQVALNERARKAFETAKKQMKAALAELDADIDDEASQALKRSQTEWESYCESQAAQAAMSYRDGSIYPLIYFSEMESLTNERAARLQAEVDQKRKEHD